MGIVTDGLIFYINHNHALMSGSLESIHPSEHIYDISVNGALFSDSHNGIFFDGVDDNITVSNIPKVESYSVEIAITKTEDRTGVIIDASEDNASNMFIFVYNSTEKNPPSVSIGSSNSVGTSNKGQFPKTNPKENELTYITYTFESYVNKSGVLDYIVRSYVNNELTATNHGASFRDSDVGLGDKITIGSRSSGFATYKGLLHSLRIYDKVLTDEEVSQNYQMGTDIGLVSESTSPEVKSISVNNYRVSRVIGYNVSTLEFSFNQDVVEWRVVLLGSSHDTGTILDSGGETISDDKVFSVIATNELFQEGENRINIYGKNADGNWTLYVED